jgi:hypothetical protein
MTTRYRQPPLSISSPAAAATPPDPLYSLGQRVSFMSGNATQNGKIIRVDAGRIYGSPRNTYVIQPDGQPNAQISLPENRIVGPVPAGSGRRRKSRKHKKSKKSKKTRKH